MRRRLIVAAFVAALAAHGVAGCAWREAAKGAADGAGKGAAFGPWGTLAGAVLGALGLLPVRHVERRRMKRQHTTERAADRARIAELERALAAARAQPSRER